MTNTNCTSGKVNNLCTVGVVIFNPVLGGSRPQGTAKVVLVENPHWTLIL
jgi:hypothetical protein